jgi:DNA repair exonuclease SbcCD nuclease subunit
MKYIVVGDTHIGTKKSSKKYHDIVTNLFTQICEYAKANDIRYLIQGGDLFDNRKALTHSSIDCALGIASMLDETFEKVYFIVGNHDTASKDTMFPHSLMIFNEHTNIEVVDKPTTIDDILMLPWMFDIDNDMTDAKVCIGHFDINGAMMNSSGTVSRNHRLNFSDFSKYDITLSCHYHTPKLYQHNVLYIGSPYQLTFNDMNSNRGFVVLDTDKEEMVESILFHDYPHHYAYTDKSEDLSDVPGNIIRLSFSDDYGIDGNKEIIQRFRELKPYSLRIKYYRLDEGMTDDKIDEQMLVKSKLDIINDYHNKADLPEGINKVLLDKVTMSIYKELKNE